MKLSYSYKRWSTKSQTDRDSGVRQTNSAVSWMKEFGTPLGYILSDETFTDEGKSGYKGKHIAVDDEGVATGNLMKFIQSVQSGKIKRDSILLIDEISRFSRLQPSEAVPLFMNVINSGIGLVFTGGYDKRIITKELINKDGYLLPSIITDMIRVYRESEEKGRKVRLAKQTMNDNHKKGIVQRNNLPKYFSFVSDNPYNPKCNVGKYVHNDRTHIVADIVKDVIAGKSLYSIAKDMNEKKIKTFKGSEWSGNGINKILRNRLLIGEYKGIKKFVPRIVEDADFNKVQSILNNNTFNAGKVGQMINIFRGVCFCSDCGKPMSVMASSYNGNNYRYLRCSSVSAAKKGCSNRKAILLNEMERDFFIEYLFKTPTQLLNDGDNEEVKELKQSITVNTIKLQAVKAQIDKLVVILETVELDELKEKSSKLRIERDRLMTDIDKSNLTLSTVQDSPNTFVNLQKLVLNCIYSQNEFNELIMKDGISPLEWAKTSTRNKINFTQLQRVKEQIQESLNDNYVREGIRVMLPSLVGKIKVNTTEQFFTVLNRMGKVVFKSKQYQSKRNCSDTWKASIKNYTTRKVNGKVIELKRK